MESRFHPHKGGDLPQLQVEVDQEGFLSGESVKLDPDIHGYGGAPRPAFRAEEGQDLPARRPSGSLAPQTESPHDPAEGVGQVRISGAPPDDLGDAGPHGVKEEVL